MPTFSALLKNALRDDVDKLIYELSDGERSTREIERLITGGGRRVTHATVANLWQKWNLTNLVMPAMRRGRYKRVVPLESIGIDVPPLRVTTTEEGTDGEEET